MIPNETQTSALRSWLHGQLDEAFRESAAEYNRTFYRPDYSNLEPGLDAISQWHEKSIEAVAKAYSLAVKTHPDEAEELVWQIVDRFFGWSGKEDRKKSDKFLVWFRTIGFDNPRDFSLFTARNPECASRTASLADRLTCDFRTSFERRISVLRAEHALDLHETHRSNHLPNTNSEASADSWSRLRHSAFNGETEKERGMARASIVLHIRNELRSVRRYLASAERVTNAAKRHSTLVIFRTPQNIELLLDLIRGSKIKKPIMKFAYEIAAVEANLAMSTMENAWKDFSPERGKKRKKTRKKPN